MALGAVLAAALNTAEARRFGLYIDGVDVILQPGTTTNRYGTLLDSVSITEAAPGGVSSMSFTIDDPSGTVSLYEGARVRFVNLALDVTEFHGFVQTAMQQPNGIGRQILVDCIGIESVLDWMIVPTLTVNSATTLPDAVQQICSTAYGVGVVLGWAQGTDLDHTVQVSSSITVGRDLTFSGQTLRQALADVGSPALENYGPQYAFSSSITFDGNVLFVGPAITSQTYGVQPVTSVAVSTSGPIYPTRQEHSPLQGDAVRNVYVIGGTANGTGFVSDGSGIPGPTAVITDNTILTLGARIAAGYAVMGESSPGQSGYVSLSAYSQTSTRNLAIRAWSELTLTDPALGLSSVLSKMQTITKQYNGGTTEEWSIDYGTRPTSGIQAIRALSTVVN